MAATGWFALVGHLVVLPGFGRQFRFTGEHLADELELRQRGCVLQLEAQDLS